MGKKLKSSKLIKIQEEIKNNNEECTYADIGRKYGVHRGTVSKIAKKMKERSEI